MQFVSCVQGTVHVGLEILIWAFISEGAGRLAECLLRGIEDRGLLNVQPCLREVTLLDVQDLLAFVIALILLELGLLVGAGVSSRLISL